jgi:hypothetical protein
MGSSHDSAVFRCRRPLDPIEEDDDPPASQKHIVPTKLREWVQDLDETDRPVAQTLPGDPSQQTRLIQALLADVSPHVVLAAPDIGVEALTERLKHLPVPGGEALGLPVDLPWQLFWALVFTNPLVVPEPLRTHVDNSFMLAAELHKVLWEARFLVREGTTTAELQRFGGAVMSWATGAKLTPDEKRWLAPFALVHEVQFPDERMDALGFFLTLCRQNELLERAFVVVRGLEEAVRRRDRGAIRGLSFMLSNAKRWAHLGDYPLAFIIPFNADVWGSRLRRIDASLHEIVAEGLVWTESD